ncbi:unnamed protein product [Closterium sp. NIES-53]
MTPAWAGLGWASAAGPTTAVFEWHWRVAADHPLEEHWSMGALKHQGITGISWAAKQLGSLFPLAFHFCHPPFVLSFRVLHLVLHSIVLHFAFVHRPSDTFGCSLVDIGSSLKDVLSGGAEEPAENHSSDSGGRQQRALRARRRGGKEAALQQRWSAVWNGMVRHEEEADTSGNKLARRQGGGTSAEV